MALLGWYPRDGVEFMPNKQLQQKFDLTHCSKSPAMLDFFLTEKNERKHREKSEKTNSTQQQEEIKALSLTDIKESINKKSKLNWLNGLLSTRMPLDILWQKIRPYIMEDTELASMLASNEDKLKTRL